jgi:hypothetical protein
MDSSNVPTTFSHPFTMVIAGPTMSGKTFFVRQLLTNPKLIQPAPQRIVWIYSEWQPEYDIMKQHFKHIEFIKGWSPDLYDGFRPSIRNLLVLDDVMTSTKNDMTLSDLFTKGASHRNLSVLFITQNLFFQGRAAVDVRRNSQYIILFKCRQDKRQVTSFAHQVFPDNPKFLMDAFADAISHDHGHLLVDLKPTCPDEFILRSNVLNDDVVVYMEPDAADLIYNKLTEWMSEQK